VRARILSILTAFALLLPGASALGFECGAEWELAPCCCGEAKAPASAPSFERTCCCELRRTSGSPERADRLAIEPAGGAILALVPVAVTATLAPLRLLAPAVRDLARGPPGRSLLAHKTSLRC
jgi:hypothetical protein